MIAPLLAAAANATQCAVPPTRLSPAGGDLPSVAVVRVFGQPADPPPTIRVGATSLDGGASVADRRVWGEGPGIWRVELNGLSGAVEVVAAGVVGAYRVGDGPAAPTSPGVVTRVTERFPGLLVATTSVSAPAYRVVVVPVVGEPTTVIFPSESWYGEPRDLPLGASVCGGMAGPWSGAERVDVTALPVDGSAVPAGTFAVPASLPFPPTGRLDLLMRGWGTALDATPRDVW